jgi:hypothetical protein
MAAFRSIAWKAAIQDTTRLRTLRIFTIEHESGRRSFSNGRDTLRYIMDIGSFRIIYGTTPRRTSLIDLLEIELKAVIFQGWEFRALVYGSVVTYPEKQEPGDIDVLVSISQPLGAPRWQKIDQSGDMHMLGSCLTSKFDSTDPNSAIRLRQCHEPSELVHQFNEHFNNMGEVISINPTDCVEVTI